MERIEKTVFISYRRTNAPWALAVFQDLTHHGFDVFIDYTGINSGSFETVIIESIKARAHFVVLLTPSARDRCSDPGDWLRREIETALEVKRNIIPLLLEGFDFSAPNVAGQLKGRLSALKEYNGLDVPAAYFSEAMKRLRDTYLSVPLDAVLRPPSIEAQQAAKSQQAAACNAPAVPKTRLAAQESIGSTSTTTTFTPSLRKQVWPSPLGRRALLGSGVLISIFAAGSYLAESRRLNTNEEGRRAATPPAATNPEGASRGQTTRPPSGLTDATVLNNRGTARKAEGIGSKPAATDRVGAPQDETIRPLFAPQDATGFKNRGLDRHIKGDLDGALQDYNEAIRLKPDYALAFYDRAIARKAKGDLDGALEDYNEAVRLNPNNPDFYYNRAIARRARGDLDGALKDYNEAIHLKPDYALAFYNRAHLRQTQGDRKGAANDYQRYLDLGGGASGVDQAKVEQLIRDLQTPATK
jgi:tetratricopeptide (TPR) repeat protein